MNIHAQRVNPIRGVTLIELMIALAISGILLVGVGTIYGTSRRTYTVDEEFAHLQQDARVTMKYLIEDIRMAGYMGCAWNNGDASKFQCYLAGGSYVCDNLTAGIDGYDATGSGWNKNGAAATLPAQFPATPTASDDSDVIVIRRGSDTGVKLTKNKDAANFTISNMGSSITPSSGTDCHTPTGICEGDILLASDCNKARVFQASQLGNVSSPPNSIEIIHDASGNPGNATTPVNRVSWGGNSDPSNDFNLNDTEIMKFSTFAYYVGTNANGHPALFRHNGINGSASEELIEGVENMQVQYGVDTDGDGIANYYETANGVNFGNSAQPIVSVRIGFLMRNKEDLPGRTATATTTPVLDGSFTNASDQRLRKTFTTTIKIRNKGL